MANICMDTVVFYAASEAAEKGLAALKQAVNSCYPTGTSVDDSGLCRIFERNEIPTDCISLRSNVVDVCTEDSHITLYRDSAWNPMYEAYLSIANFFGVNFELEAEEPGCGIYINTDTNGAYLTNQYKACLSERPSDGSLNMLFDNAHGDTDFYFSSDKELLQWFRERGGIIADSIETLRETLDCECVSIHEFVNPY
ncbi:hypothetical protein [Faecalibaculum rodentium]|uniref:hypothetical protein n=1 Tax=Faecalibaculum rodentium TaxID=1702221 RepID=UPI0026330414|nr:hypothetical protein [Faecalibaculum rodentium]